MKPIFIVKSCVLGRTNEVNVFEGVCSTHKKAIETIKELANIDGVTLSDENIINLKIRGFTVVSQEIRYIITESYINYINALNKSI